MLSLPPNLLTEFSNPVFEEDGETPARNQLEEEKSSDAKLAANGFGIDRSLFWRGAETGQQDKQDRESQFGVKVKRLD